MVTAVTDRQCRSITDWSLCRRTESVAGGDPGEGPEASPNIDQPDVRLGIERPRLERLAAVGRAPEWVGDDDLSGVCDP